MPIVHIKMKTPMEHYGAQDDIAGFKHVVTAPKGDCYDTVNLAWISDNDGHGTLAVMS